MARRLSMLVDYQKCRNWGHAWDDFIAPRTSHPVIYESHKQETLRCLRCETERFRGIGFQGEVESNYYDYPDGYVMTADDRPELAVIRLSLIAEIQAATNLAKRTAESRRHVAPRRTHKAARKSARPRRAEPRRGAGRRVTA